MSEIQPIVMPKWGLAMEEGTLTSWLVQDRIPDREGAGDRGNRDDEDRQRVREPGLRAPFAVSSPRRATWCRSARCLRCWRRRRSRTRTSTALSPVSWSKRRRTQTTQRELSRERRMERNGRPLVYKAAGAQSAATPVVLIHGFGGDSDNWLFNIEELAKDRPVYALDLPGHGKSTKTLASGDLGELADAVVDLHRRDRGGDRPISSAIRSARRSLSRVLADRPERVASIVGVAPAGLDDAFNALISSRASSRPRSARM